LRQRDPFEKLHFNRIKTAKSQDDTLNPATCGELPHAWAALPDQSTHHSTMLKHWAIPWCTRRALGPLLKAAA
jgi:hypothetical protein